MALFSEQLWASIADDIVPAILHHPFIKGLATGDLQEEVFSFYVQQDSAYLQVYGRGLAILAAKSELPGPFMMFCEHARNTLIVEEALHREFFEHWNQNNRLEVIELQPNAALYTSMLMQTALLRPYFEGVAAFFPCYWIYLHVGKHLVERGSPNTLYQRWINTYAGDAFEAVVEEMRNHVNAIAAPLTNEQRRAMVAHFRKGSQLEWLFWDGAYHRKMWPFPS